MTASRKIQSLAKRLHDRHNFGADPEARAALSRFGEGLRAKRGKRTIVQIATLAGISKTQYHNIEQGNNWPSVPVYRKLCLVLGIALPALLK